MNWWACPHKTINLTNTVHFSEKCLPPYIITPDEHVLWWKKVRHSIFKSNGFSVWWLCSCLWLCVYSLWTSWLRGHPCRFSLWLRAILLNIHWLLSLLGGHGIELLFSLFWCWLGIFLILPCMHCLLFFFGCGGWIYRVLCAGSLFGVYPIFWFLVGKGPPDLTTIEGDGWERAQEGSRAGFSGKSRLFLVHGHTLL